MDPPLLGTLPPKASPRSSLPPRPPRIREMQARQLSFLAGSFRIRALLSVSEATISQSSLYTLKFSALFYQFSMYATVQTYYSANLKLSYKNWSFLGKFCPDYTDELGLILQIPLRSNNKQNSFEKVCTHIWSLGHFVVSTTKNYHFLYFLYNT